MLELILDFVFDLILEGSIIFISEKKVPIPIRVIAFIVVVLFYLGIGGICIYAGVCSWLDKATITAIIFFALSIFIFIGGFVQIRKELKKRNDW